MCRWHKHTDSLCTIGAISSTRRVTPYAAGSCTVGTDMPITHAPTVLHHTHVGLYHTLADHVPLAQTCRFPMHHRCHIFHHRVLTLCVHDPIVPAPSVQYLPCMLRGCVKTERFYTPSFISMPNALNSAFSIHNFEFLTTVRQAIQR